MHKSTLKIRPIVSAREGIFDRLGWLLQTILQPLLKQVKAHLTNTDDLIKRFHEAPADRLKGKIPISFDVVALYTNIDADESITTTLEYIVESNLYLYGLHTGDIWELYTFCSTTISSRLAARFTNRLGAWQWEVA